jgi:hypothetical protein
VAVLHLKGGETIAVHDSWLLGLNFIIDTMNKPQEWRGELDALTAAPENHTLLFENDAVRVLDTIVRPSEIVPLHAHKWPSTHYLLSWSDFVRRDATGSVLLDSRTIAKPSEGAAFWSSPLLPHTLENVGTCDLRVISVELKTA